MANKMTRAAVFWAFGVVMDDVMENARAGRKGPLGFPCQGLRVPKV
jgi:hypothetical protein